MKKYYFLIIVALILGLVLTGCSLLSNISQVPDTEQSGMINLTKGTPGTITLYAGQDIPVGTVSVSNDGTNLYVTYNTTGGWVMTETHLAVATSLDVIPQTKKGNPIPGQFPYKHEDLGYVTSDPYEIPLVDLGVGADDNLYIAAHAKVIRPIEDCWEPVWQIGDVESNPTAIPSTALSDEFGGKNSDGSYYALGDIVDYFIPPNDFRLDYDSDMAAFPHAFAPPGWIHETYGDVFTETVNIHYSEYMPFGGKLTWRWTAGLSAPETYDVSHDASPLQTYVDQGIRPEGFYEHSLTIPVAFGNQMITFDHKLAGDGGRWDWIRLEKPCVQEESAWAGINEGEIPFPGKNWATYFTYTIIPQYEFVETVKVPGTNDIGVDSIHSLGNGQDYMLEASGIYRFANWGGDFGMADAEYSNRTAAYTPDGIAGWIQGEGYFASECGLDVQVDNACVHWGDPFNPEHNYEIPYVGTGSSVHFHIYDNNYSDNSGLISVKIWIKNY